MVKFDVENDFFDTIGKKEKIRKIENKNRRRKNVQLKLVK